MIKPLLMKPNQLAIIIPCHNEEKAIRPVLDHLLQIKERILKESFIEAMEIIVVNDNSNDASANLLQSYKDRIQVLSSPVNLGYGGALKAGFSLSDCEFLSFYDMDATYDPVDLIPMLQTIEKEQVDMVCGDRLSPITMMSPIRWFGNYLFVRVIQCTFLKQVNDSCTGLRVFRAKYKQLIEQHSPNKLNFSLSMTLLFLRFSIPFKEIPISYSHRIGDSKLNVSIDGLRFLATILYSWVSYFIIRKKIESTIVDIASKKLASKTQ